MQDRYNRKGYSLDPLNQKEFELDRSHSEFPKNDVLPEGKLEAEKIWRKYSSVLVVRGPQVIQALLLWAILTVHAPRDIRVIA